MRTLIAGIVFWATLAAFADSDVAPRRVGDIFRDCVDCPELVVVPAGEFSMGSTASEGQREGVPAELAAAERPVHRVAIAAPFAVGRTEVTRAEYAAFVVATGRSDGDRCFVWDITSGAWDNRAGTTWRNPGFAQTGDHPVVCVSWEDAAAYAVWLSNLTGQSYRLPTEAEWEYAARAGSTTARDWGVERSTACAHANVNDHSRANADPALPRTATDIFMCSDGYAFTAPAAMFAANAFGLHDMIGNVWEWVADCFNPTYVGAPADGRAWPGGDCGQRTNRGGSWADPPWRVRAAFREWDPPHGRYAIHGFRVARDIE